MSGNGIVNGNLRRSNPVNAHMTQQRIYIVAGERSGDQHAARVAWEFQRHNPGADIRGFGGFKMREAGVSITSFYHEMAFMGFWETVWRYSTVKDKLVLIKYDLEAFNPHAIIFVDFGGFNMRVAKFAQRLDAKKYYYIPPKAWAWNSGRAKKLGKMMDHVFAIFPFEEEFFRSYGAKTTYVGNPTKFMVDEYFKLEQTIEKRAVALLPGSRQQEIEKNMPVMNELAKRMPKQWFYLATTDDFNRTFYQELIDAPNIIIPPGSTFNLLSKAKCAVVCSGTATLEAALLNVPQVVCYKANRFSFAIGKMLVKIKFISLVNILLKREVVKELMQGDYNPERLEEEVNRLLQPETAKKMELDYSELHNILGKKVPHETIYKLVVPSLPKP